jgi:hypothetical protein
MSHGPGKWQRKILEALQEREGFYLREVAGDSRSEYSAFHRAACTLYGMGRIEILRYTAGACGYNKVFIRRAGSLAIPENRIPK